MNLHQFLKETLFLMRYRVLSKENEKKCFIADPGVKRGLIQSKLASNKVTKDDLELSLSFSQVLRLQVCTNKIQSANNLDLVTFLTTCTR